MRERRVPVKGELESTAVRLEVPLPVLNDVGCW